MNWDDKCRQAVCEEVDRKKDEKPRRVLAEMARESGIPYDVLKGWYFPNQQKPVVNPKLCVPKGVTASFD